MDSDISWNKFHDFRRGWGWMRKSDLAKVFPGDCKKRGIDFESWITLDKDIQEKVVQDIKQEKEKLRKYNKEHPVKIDFTEISIPIIRKPFPFKPINELC